MRLCQSIMKVVSVQLFRPLCVKPPVMIGEKASGRHGIRHRHDPECNPGLTNSIREVRDRVGKN